MISHRLYGGVRLVDRPAPMNVGRLDLGALPLIRQMHKWGVYVDVEEMEVLGEEIKIELELLEERIRTEVGRSVNPESSQQVARLVFHELALSPPGGIKLTKTGKESTVDDVLSTVVDQSPIVKMILDHRGLKKLYGTYAGKLTAVVDEYSRIHTTFSATRASTGRLASSDPNLQNIPIRSEWGKRVRDCFRATPGEWWRRMGYGPRRTVLVAVDLSQIEMVWAAHLSGDEIMRDIFVRGDDIHTRTALAMFRLPAEAACCMGKGECPRGKDCGWSEFKTHYRLPAKTLGFGILYGVTADGLVLQIASAGGPVWGRDETEGFIGEWFRVYDGIYRWMQAQHGRARRYGMVWDAFGRVRMIPEVYSRHKGVVNTGLREAGNQPVQASAAGTLKLAMAEIMEVVRWYQDEGVVCWPLLQIHDELVFEVEERVAEEFALVVHGVMTEAVPMSVPVRASMEVGDRWGDLK